MHASNAYCVERKRRHPELKCWKDKKRSAPFTVSNIYHFLAMIYYFGVTQLPSKSDYWVEGHYVPQHNIAHELGMTRERFKFIWRNFHVSHPTEDDYVDAGNKNYNDDDKELLHTTMERVVHDQ